MSKIGEIITKFICSHIENVEYFTKLILLSIQYAMCAYSYWKTLFNSIYIRVTST